MMKKSLCAALTLSVSCTYLCAQAPTPPAAPAAPPAAPAAGTIDAASPDLQTAVNKAYELGFAAMGEGKFKEALEKVDFIRSKMNPMPADVVFLEAACQFNLGDFAKAATAFEAYVTANPTGSNIGAVKLGLGRSYLKLNKIDEGVKLMKEVAADPALKGEAGLLLAEHYKKANSPDEALAILTGVIGDGARSAEQIQAALMAKGDTEKAAEMLQMVKGGGGASGENVIQLNNIGLKLGDKMIEEKRFAEALGAYQSVRRKTEVERLQKERIARITDMLAKNQGSKEELEAKLSADKSMLDELEKRTDYDASLFYRLGRCYFEMQRPWEAILAFDEIVKVFKDFPQRDRAQYGMIMANASLKRLPESMALCESFIRDYPESSELPAISELFGMLAYQSGNLQQAADNFEKIKSFPKVDKERAYFLRGNVLFEMQKFQDSVTEFEILKKDYPQSAYLDDATYRIALAAFYQNDSKATIKSLKDYIEEHPKGQYIIDAKYRLAFIRFQGGDVDNSMVDLLKLVEESPNDQNIAQVYSLLGDGFKRKAESNAEKAEENYDKALEGYSNAVKKARSEDVLNYAMENATDLYQATNRWADLAGMWQTYLETHKESDNALKAIYWISRALIKDQKIDEAKKLLADNIRPYISNPIKDQVEPLIQQLVGQMVPKRRRVTPVAEAAPAAPTPAAEGATATATPAPPPAAPAPPPAATTNAAQDMAAEFDKLEKQLEEMLKPEPMTPTANIRIMYARGSLAGKMKQAEKMEKIFNIIIDVANPEDLSPLLLSIVGDNARKKGNLDKASSCYERLRTIFPKSEFADGAPVGLGEILFEKGEFEKALAMFEEATGEKYQGSGRLLDATLGKAKTLLKLGKYSDAEKEYDAIARTKEWRSAWAEALFGLGQVNEAKKSWAAANAFYIRVFVAHQKYKEWLAKAYLQSARCFVLLNKKPDAKRTLEEMLKRTDIKDQPAFKEAQAELAKL
jgi:tetratricopeptide (TPR) repeat protein